MQIHFKSPLKKKNKKFNGAEFKIFPFNFNSRFVRRELELSWIDFLKALLLVSLAPS
jgi:hypothetical protein